MNDADSVCGRERAQKLTRVAERFEQRELATRGKLVSHGLPSQILHDDERPLVLGLARTNDRDDIGMVQPTQRVGLQSNSIGNARISGQTCMLNLGNAGCAELAVLSEEHLTHTPRSQQPYRAVPLSREWVVRYGLGIGETYRRKHGADRAVLDSGHVKSASP